MAKTKDSKTPSQLVQLLKNRDLVIPSDSDAERFLANVNYYKLKAYLRFFEQPCKTRDHCFPDGVSLDDVLSLYRFDRKLRLLLCDMLERFEVAVRTRWALELSQHTGNSQAHEDPGNFTKKQHHSQAMDVLKNEYQKSKETYAEHHRQNYRNLVTPPIWVSVELLSFSQISKWLSNTKSTKIKREISSHFDLPERFFVGFVRQAGIVRNSCSHHSRVWNKAITFRPPLPQTSYRSAIGLNTAPADNDKIFNVLVTLSYIAKRISPGHSWNERLVEFLKKDPSRVTHMGFPTDWEGRFALHA